MPSLLDLPTELIVEVVVVLAQPKDELERDAITTAALRHLCLICKFLNTIVQPILYESIRMTYSKTPEYTSLKTNGILETPSSILETVKTLFLNEPLAIWGDEHDEEYHQWTINHYKTSLDILRLLSNVETLHLMADRLAKLRNEHLALAIALSHDRREKFHHSLYCRIYARCISRRSNIPPTATFAFTWKFPDSHLV